MRYRQKAVTVKLFQAKRCGDDITMPSGYTRSACRRSVENSHTIEIGIFALCRSCAVKILMNNKDGCLELA